MPPRTREDARLTATATYPRRQGQQRNSTSAAQRHDSLDHYHVCPKPSTKTPNLQKPSSGDRLVTLRSLLGINIKDSCPMHGCPSAKSWGSAEYGSLRLWSNTSNRRSRDAFRRPQGATASLGVLFLLLRCRLPHQRTCLGPSLRSSAISRRFHRYTPCEVPART